MNPSIRSTLKPSIGVLALWLAAVVSSHAQNLPIEATGASNPAKFDETPDFTWYVDPVNGNDSWAGTSANP